MRIGLRLSGFISNPFFTAFVDRGLHIILSIFCFSKAALFVVIVIHYGKFITGIVAIECEGYPLWAVPINIKNIYQLEKLII